MNKKISIIIFLLGIVLLFIGIFFINSSHKMSYKNTSVKNAQTVLTVEKVLDGDTVVDNTNRHIRYLGINTAEKGESYSKEAADFNKQLVLHKPIHLEFDSETTDRYGRTLAYIFVDNIFINQQMVQNGLAITDFMQKNMKYQKELTDAQTYAKTHCLGMWNGLCSSDATCISIPTIHAYTKGQSKNKNAEWIEIKNTCTQSLSMKDWLLKDSSSSNRYTFKDVVLQPEETIMLYSGCGKDTTHELYWSCPEPEYAIWNNDSDHAFLYNSKGELVADYQY